MQTNLASSAAESAGKYLTVVLADEAYGIAVLKVREIIRLQRITPVPQMPEFVKGVINLRGRIVPIVDLRVKFGVAADVTERACIVVVQVNRADAASLHIGLVVDCVEEVVNLTSTDIASTPSFGSAVRADYLLGMAKVKDRVKALLDIDRVLTADNLQAMAIAA